MTMTNPDPHTFLRPYVQANYLTQTAAGQLQTQFVSLAGLRAWAAVRGLPLRTAMSELLEQHIWPERFRRNFGLVAAHELARRLQSRVLVLGCGGLGGHVAELLARTGVGSIRLVDNDIFEESNLNRQRFCTERVLGQPKVIVVRDALADIASHVETEALELVADGDNLSSLVSGMDVALDCLDSISAKTALEQAALAAGVAFVHGSVLRDEGFCYASSGPQARLEELYPAGQSASELELARREGVGALAPASVACLMVKLALRAIQRRTASSALYHLDLSVPELERFDWAVKN